MSAGWAISLPSVLLLALLPIDRALMAVLFLTLPGSVRAHLYCVGAVGVAPLACVRWHRFFQLFVAFLFICRAYCGLCCGQARLVHMYGTWRSAMVLVPFCVELCSGRLLR